MPTQRRVRPFRTAKYGRRCAALTSSNLHATLQVMLATPWISNGTAPWKSCDVQKVAQSVVQGIKI
jgi:hypothetical protein